MPSLGIIEDDLEQLTLTWLQDLGYAYHYGTTIGPGGRWICCGVVYASLVH
jgi:hypothetical protein